MTAVRHMEVAFLKFRLRQKMLISKILGLWIVIFGLELQTQKLKALGSGTHIRKLSVIQAGWENSQTTGRK